MDDGIVHRTCSVSDSAVAEISRLPIDERNRALANKVTFFYLKRRGEAEKNWIEEEDGKTKEQRLDIDSERNTSYLLCISERKRLNGSSTIMAIRMVIR